jgi:hypothetical protein
MTATRVLKIVARIVLIALIVVLVLMGASYIFLASVSAPALSVAAFIITACLVGAAVKTLELLR